MAFLNKTYMILIFVSLIWCNYSQFRKANREWKFQSCNHSNGDDCAQRLYIYGYRPVNDTSSARNEKEMTVYCQETREAEKCMKDWGKNCLNTFERQCLNLLLSGASSSRRALCTSKGKQRFLDNRQCFVKSVNAQHDCMDEFKRDMSTLAKIEKKKFGAKLRSGCCFADKWRKCFRETARKLCDESGVKFLEWVVDPYVEDAVDLGCKKEWTHGSEICTDTVRQIPTRSSLSNTIVVSKSLMLPLYNMLAEFSKDQDVKDLSSLKLPD